MSFRVQAHLIIPTFETTPLQLRILVNLFSRRFLQASFSLRNPRRWSTMGRVAARGEAAWHRAKEWDYDASFVPNAKSLIAEPHGREAADRRLLPGFSSRGHRYVAGPAVRPARSRTRAADT